MTHAEKRAEQEFPIIRLDYVEDLNEPERTAFIAGWEADKWIRVEDELPTELYKPNGRRRQVWAANLADEDSMIIVFADKLSECNRTHWQPLPSPPKTK
jgi:hypothetical protein